MPQSGSNRPTKPIPPAGLARVLVATDFGFDGDRAARRATRLPLASRATIVVVHVLPGGIAPSAASVVAGAAIAELDTVADKLLSLLARRGRHDVTIRTRLARGVAADEIARVAQVNAAELIVVGRGQHRFVGRFGSTAQRVVHQARVPVLLVRRPPTRPYSRVVVGVDLSADALVAARIAARITSSPRAGLVAVHAYDDPRADLAPTLSTKVAKAQWKRFLPTLASTSRQIRTALKTAAPDRTWSVSFRPGDPRLQLIAAVERRRADLLVVGTRSARGLERLLLGSVAESVLRRAGCDVLVSPRRRWVV